MNDEKKIKPVLNGTAETMLQCFYARAMHSKNPKNKFHDAKAEELVGKIDYDFSNAKKEGIEKSIKATGATFTWGADKFEDLKDIAVGFKKVKNDNIARGMATLNPAYKLVTWMPVVKRFAEKILVFEKAAD